MPLRDWLDIAVIQILIRHTITDAIALACFWVLLRLAGLLVERGASASVLASIEQFALIVLVLVFAGHLLYNVIKEIIHGR